MNKLLGKMIPYVCGIPGPSSLSLNPPQSPIMQSLSQEKERLYNSNQNSVVYGSNSPSLLTSQFKSIVSMQQSPYGTKNRKSPDLQRKSMNILKSDAIAENYSMAGRARTTSDSIGTTTSEDSLDKSPLSWTSGSTINATSSINEKPFNFMRMGDNLSPPEVRATDSKKSFLNLENLDRIETKSASTDDSQSSEVMPSNNRNLNLSIETISSEHMKPSAQNTDFDCNSSISSIPKTPKFARPCSLPLKPGTFTPKKHHGITPTANTLPLISPETPRPSKQCVQLYLNGHAYTYLGLKCSTKTFYCTVNRPQPVHFTNQHKLSIYSNWQTCAESNPHPLGFSPKDVMSLYDSRQSQQQQCQRCGKYTIAGQTKYTTLHSQSLICASDKLSEKLKFNTNTTVTSSSDTHHHHSNAEIETRSIGVVSSVSELSAAQSSSIQDFSISGGFKTTNDNYSFNRGRGSRLICSKCGIRSKKLSMLKKHNRSHSDTRSFTCKQCTSRYV